MNVVDRLRLEWAVQSYDSWLEIRGVRRPRRRALRRELRTNLVDASADVGVTQALFGIGSAKELAYAADDVDPSRPRWTLASIWTLVIGGALSLWLMLTVITILQTVTASGVRDRDVTVTAPPWIGTEFVAHVSSGHGPLWISANNVNVLPLTCLVVYVLVAQPWRLLRRRHRAGAVALRSH